MQGPPVNLVLLGLLILFFGLQLRRRNQQPYSGWLLGWLLVFVSYLIWDVMPNFPALNHLLELLRLDTLLLGIVSFLLSFLVPETKLRRTVLLSGWALGPGLILVDSQFLKPGLIWLYEGLALVGVIGAVIAINKLVPRRWTRRRMFLYGLCGLSFVCVIAALLVNPTRYLTEAYLAPLLLCVAVLYLASSRSSHTVRALGGLGFLLWAEFYVFQDILTPASPVVQMLYQFWDLPKYFVGTAMILDLLEASRQDVERLAKRYRLLYENLNMLFEGHPHPMWIYGVRSGQILSANAAAIQSYGFSREELAGMPASALEVSEEPSSWEAAKPALINPDLIAPGSRRALHRRKNGEIVSVALTEHPLVFEGKDAIVVLAVDVTEQDKLHQDLFHRAHHDALTQLPNRELLTDRVEQVLARSERDGKCAVLLTIDIDHFKRINDTYGHPVGDECLKLVAGRLQSRIRSVDTLARTGGEEFTVIIGGLTRREDAMTVAETLRRLFDQPLVLEDRVLAVTISIGGALFPEDGTSLDTLCKRSDDALYRAKRAGRNRCMFATSPFPLPQ